MEQAIPYICAFIGIVLGFLSGYNAGRHDGYIKGRADND